MNKSENPGFIGRQVNNFRWLWINYLCFFSLNMLEPWEQAIFNFVIVFVLMTATYSTVLFMPGHFQMLMQETGVL